MIRKNGPKLNRRKAIREEARRRFLFNRDDRNASQVYDWANGKIRRFYVVMPLSAVWPSTAQRKSGATL